MSNKFTKIFLLNQTNIIQFVQKALNKTEHIIIDKIKASVEPLKQQAIKDIEDISKEEDEFERGIGKSSIAEYRKILRIVKKGLSAVDPIQLFNDFIVKDHKLNLKDYSLLPSPVRYGNGKIDVYNLSDPLAGGIQEPSELSDEKQTEINEMGNEAILHNAQHNLWPEKDSFNVLTRPKNNRANVVNVPFNDLSKRSDAKNYEIFDKKHKRWINYDPEYIANWPSPRSNVQWAIGFKSIPSATTDSQYTPAVDQYTAFVREFMSFIIRTWSKTKETKELESILDMF